MMNHFEKYKVLTPLNHGFRSGFSCETQLLTTANDVLKSFDKNKQVDVAILDFSKAFDKVPHKKLIHKLSKYGINNSTLSWLECFLTKRSMQVVVDGVTSESTSVISGVPQGKVLGPILYLVHINDLPATVSSQVRLFADDCLLYREINALKDHLSLQRDLQALEQWADTWGMKFNASKCHILSIKEKSSYFYKLDNVILKHVPNNPYLGVLFSEDLKFSDHINNVTKKANSTIGFLHRNLRYCPLKCKRTAYLSLVRSVLEYGCTVWDPYLQRDIDQLERVLRKAIRFITGDYKSMTPGTINKLQNKLQFSPLETRRKAIRLTFMYKLVEGLVPAMPSKDFIKFQRPGRNIKPKKDPDFIYSKSPIDKYIKNNDRCLEIPDATSPQAKNSFFIKTASEWNALNNTVVHAKSPDIFKNLIQKELGTPTGCQ